MTRRHPGAKPVGDEPDTVSAELIARAAALQRFRHVPDAVLAGIVVADGLAARQPDQALPAGATDRESAARLCAGCPVQDECLELDLRWMADQTVGVFAGLTQTDRRVVHRWWAAQRAGPPGGSPGSPSGTGER
jgi:WhiB family redox-sensing transcriptional regulator